MPEMIEKYWAGKSLALDIAEMEFERAFTDCEYTGEINAKRAEFKVMAENGTDDDLFSLYSEAAAEANQQKKGIIATFIEKIGAVLRSIGEKISNFFSKKPLSDDQKKTEVEVPVDKGFIGAANKFRGMVGNAIGKIKNSALTEAFVSELEAAAVALAAKAVVGKVADKAKDAIKSKGTKTTAGEAQQTAEEVGKESKGLLGILNNLKDAVVGNDEQGNLIKRTMSAISKGAKALGDAASGLVSGVMKAIQGKKKDANKDESEAPAENNEEKKDEAPAESGDASASENKDEGNIDTNSVHDDVIDVSTDEGMLAFEAALDALVSGDSSDEEEQVTEESTEDTEEATEETVEESSEESGEDEQVTEESVSAEEAAALDEALAEFNSLFNE